MWTKERIKRFFDVHKVDTHGAINSYEISFEWDKGAGDIYHEAYMPLWSANDYVVRDVLEILGILSEQPHVRIYFLVGKARILFFEHECDPD